jgi:hypothetical protein
MRTRLASLKRAPTAQVGQTVFVINQVCGIYTDCFRYPMSPQGRTLYSPPVVGVQTAKPAYYRNHHSYLLEGADPPRGQMSPPLKRPCTPVGAWEVRIYSAAEPS